jgi:hypothetical protein
MSVLYSQGKGKVERQSIWSDEDVQNLLLCQLCVNEKVDILCCSNAGDKERVMNSRLKWDEACPHVAHFHRFTFCTGTDEDINPEKVTDDFSEGETEASSVSSGQTLLLGSRLASLELTQGDECEMKVLA